MDQEERELAASRWFEIYGEPIDCKALSEIASIVVARRFESDVEIARALGRFRKLLRQQDAERHNFMFERIPNRHDSAWAIMQRFVNAGQAAGTLSLEETAQFSLCLLGLARDNTDREREDFMQAVARTLPPWAAAHPTYRDYAVGRAAYLVERWIHARTGRSSWPDVVRCLRCHGHDLSARANPERAVRLAALRWVGKTVST